MKSQSHLGSIQRLLRFPKKIRVPQPPELPPRVQRKIGSGIDKALLTLMKGVRKSPRKNDFPRLQFEIQNAHDLYAEAGMLVAPHTFHQVPKPIRITKESKRLGPAGRYTELAFESGYESALNEPVGRRWMSQTENQTAYAGVFSHDDPTRPWLICMHGLGTGSPWLDYPSFQVRKLHKELGLNVVLPVMPAHGARRGPTQERGGLLSFELVESLHGISQAVYEARTLVHWIRAQGGTKIGFYGISMGSYVSAIISGLEEVDMVICGIPLCDIPELFSSHTTRRLRKRAEKHDILGPTLRSLFCLVSPEALTPLVAQKDRMIIAGAADRITPNLQANKLSKAWKTPIDWFPGGHVSYFWARPALQRVHQKLRQFAEIEEASK